MRFASLGSGSEGNALLVEASSGTTTTRVLLDCGFSAKEVERRLARLDCRAEDLDAIVITHEHADHIGSALTLARKWSIPLHMSWGTARAVGADEANVELNLLWGDESVAIGDVSVLAVQNRSHDAREPLQYVFSDGACRLGVLTDVGVATPHITSVLSGCDALVLESNHDIGMLAASRYPPSLKARIGGTHGHLNNEAAAILASLDRSRLRHLVAAHLTVSKTICRISRRPRWRPCWGASAIDVVVATQAEGFDWLML
ncbi:Metal-dependent hydrolase of the beta-lactamase superfamily I [Candidatus Paraburkholderia kirkii]|nr:Metal-dependent hydrolase of the beta-lactamase superfamily I [Candidatus Paraburkholderia kirkii]